MKNRIMRCLLAVVFAAATLTASAQKPIVGLISGLGGDSEAAFKNNNERNAVAAIRATRNGCRPKKVPSLAVCNPAFSFRPNPFALSEEPDDGAGTASGIGDASAPAGIR